jgi:hypothetical protein
MDFKRRKILSTAATTTATVAGTAKKNSNRAPATVDAGPRENREPNSTSTSAVAKGNTRINHNHLIASSFHLAQHVDIQGLEAAIDLQHQCEPHGYFGGCHGQNEQKHNLAVGLKPSSSGDYESQPCGVEHDLKRHQYEN